MTNASSKRERRTAWSRARDMALKAPPSRNRYVDFLRAVSIAAVVVGLIISILQAATQVNEQTLTFVPKIVLVLGLFTLLFPWIMQSIMDFALRIFAEVALRGGGPA